MISLHKIYKYIIIIKRSFYDHKGCTDFGLEFSSTKISYKKRIVGIENNAKNYEQWADRCQSELLSHI